jgi:hypothetical protein
VKVDAYHNISKDDVKPAMFAQYMFPARFAILEGELIYVRFAARTGGPCKFVVKCRCFLPFSSHVVMQSGMQAKFSMN